MWHRFGRDANFQLVLVRLDPELAERCRLAGCPHCGGALHRADYPRFSLGVVLKGFRDRYATRISFCCANCRRRATPPSVRFFGRRWHAGWIVLLVSMLERGPSDRRCAKLRHLGLTVGASTWQRWRRWWREDFVRTRLWASIRGAWVEVPEHVRWPRPLWSGDLHPVWSMRQLLYLLSPLTVPFADCLREVG